MTPRKVIARIGDETRAVDLRADGTATVVSAGGAETFSLRYLGHGRFRVRSSERTLLAHAVDDGETRWVFVDGEVVRLELEAPGARRRRAPTGHESLSAPMPATVVRVLVAPGDRVAKGAPLAVLEAMKMELSLRAPRDAIVEAVRCVEGELVQPGVPLIDLDETVGREGDTA
jgi:3-methylcrotonyl-CoA carboxylase alpha subunit